MPPAFLQGAVPETGLEPTLTALVSTHIIGEASKSKS